jgi:hypothetical protein
LRVVDDCSADPLGAFKVAVWSKALEHHFQFASEIDPRPSAKSASKQKSRAAIEAALVYLVSFVTTGC